jgi:hypothetical protein
MKERKERKRKGRERMKRREGDRGERGSRERKMEEEEGRNKREERKGGRYIRDVEIILASRVKVAMNSGRVKYFFSLICKDCVWL